MKIFRAKSNNTVYAKRGFTLLIAVLATSVILSVSLGVFDIITKEIKLAGLGRESQISFFAADAGVECAFYWEIKHNAFTKTANGKTISCGGISTLVGKNEISSFALKLGDTSCAEVTVDKSVSKETTIRSKGYNVAYDSSTGKCDTASARRVERAIRLTLKKS